MQRHIQQKILTIPLTYYVSSGGVEGGILATYLPNVVDETDTKVSLAIPPPVTLYEALAHIKDPLLFSPTANIPELQNTLNRENQGIKALEFQRRCQHVQRRTIDFLGSLRTPKSSSR